MKKSSIPARPQRHSPQVKELALRKVLGTVLKWLPAAQRKPERVLAALVAAFDNDTEMFATKLERRGWSVDEELVKILDRVSLSAALDAVTAEWVDHFNIKVPFEVGDLVCTSRFAKARIAAVNSWTAELALVLDEDGDPNMAHIVPVECAIALRTGAVGAAA